MKLKNKGKKIHPTPSSSSSSHNHNDVLSVLNLLPATILTLTSILSLQDREVLAYMITRSLKTPSSKNTINLHKNSKRNSMTASHSKEAPFFDCDCFDCYTSYWFKWDSSPNRELIHQAIEAFEDQYLSSNEKPNKKNTRGKRKSGRRVGLSDLVGRSEEALEKVGDEGSSSCVGVVEEKVEMENAVVETEEVVVAVEEEVVEAVMSGGLAVNNRRGLVRKLLPDVMGLLNSRLWSLWSPNV